LAMSFSALRYTWLTYRRDQLWFPLALFTFFVVILLFFPQPGMRFNLARAYLGFIVPLIGGITAAYAVLDDPALELRFACPVRAEETLFTRVGLIFSIQAVSALTFQLLTFLLGIDLGRLGGPFDVQFVWLVPTLGLIALGTFGALATTQTTVGAFLAGSCWLVQVTMRSWFEKNASHFFLFMGVFSPDQHALATNRWALLALSTALLGLSSILLRRQERYL
jgi:hypothetical protein